MLGRKTLVKDYCWVCEARFKSSRPPGPANREDHHIFPRNAGGTDGPLVSLCDTDHTNLHLIARRLHSKKPFTDLLIGKNAEQARKLVWLGTKAYEAETLTADDDNKKKHNSVTLTATDLEMLKRLKAVFPTLSRNDIIVMGLRNLYQSKLGKRN
jgi:hypothetical protein